MIITPKSRYDKIVTVRFTEEMFAKLEKEAKRSKVSIAEVIRHCVEYPVKEV